MKRSLRRLPIHIVLIISCAVMAFPLVIMVLTSLKSNEEVYQNPIGLPAVPTLENFVTSWIAADFGTLFVNSILFTGVSMVIATFAASLAAYASVRRSGRLGSATYLVLAAGVFLPLNLAIIPQFRVLKDFGLINSYTGVIAIYAALSIPFGVFLIASFMRQIPQEIVEAAVIDGAGYFRMYTSIFLPLARPAIVTFWILQGVAVWNDYLVPLLILSDSSKRTLTTGILAFRQAYLADWGNIMAGVVIMSAPIVILFLIAQRHFVNGIYAGAVK